MAAAASLTATFSGCRLGASRLAGGTDCARSSRRCGARAPTLTPDAPGPTRPPRPGSLRECARRLKGLHSLLVWVQAEEMLSPSGCLP
ncbi:hypothetical protein NN561_014672 [Cricetulus griseus]